MSLRKAIGIDFGGTAIKSAVVQGGRILERGPTLDTIALASEKAILDAIFGVIDALRKAHPEVEAIGVGLPGFVDSENGIVHELTNVGGWHQVPLRNLIRDRTGLVTIIENDANAMAYGEFRHGAAKGGRNTVCVTLGTGVGGGLILEGRLYRGSRLGAGEIGHMSIDYRGIVGPHNNPGGLEEYVGNQQIAERASRKYAEAGQPKSPEQCTPQALNTAARAGDKIAQEIWNEVGFEIGMALSSVAFLLNPDTIVIGGGVAKAGDLVLDPIRKTINERTFVIFHDQLRIVPAALGNDAGMIGCAELALDLADEP